MLKKTITYTDYNGVTRTEVHYFNLNKAELAMMDLSEIGGLKENLTAILNKMDIPKLAKFFEDLIMKSYGEKSPDGKRFMKSNELSEAFKQSEAYSELFMELLTSDHAAQNAADFLTGVLPPDLQNDARDALKEYKPSVQFPENSTQG